MNNTIDLINIIEGKPYYQAPVISSLKDMLRRCEAEYSDSIAFKFRKEPHAETESRTYKQFVSDVNSFGSALLGLGLLNKRFAIIGENRYEWAVSFLAIVNGAGIAVPLDKMLPPNEIEAMLERGEVDVLIYSNSFQSVADNLLKKNTRLKALICMNPENEKEGFYSFSKLVDSGSNLIASGFSQFTNCDIDNVVMRILLFTSGTSATSKAVMLSHKNICADIMGLGGIVHFKPGQSVLSILPLHHTFENTAGFLFPLYLGMTVSISDGLKYISKNLAEYKPDCLIGVPLLFDKFRDRIKEELKKKNLTKKVSFLMKIANGLSYIGLDLRRKLFKKLLEPFGGKLAVIVTGGAPIETETTKIYENIGIRVYQGYGLTETSPVVAGGNDRLRKIGTCGQPLPGVKIAIANPDSSGSGELVVKGDTVMLGYWNNEEATKEAIRKGWFHTGDLGCIDKRGLIHVTGRVKSMIVLKNGKKVFPEELESHINRLDYVKESLVWGEAAADGSVEICAKIIIDKEQILNFVKSPDDEEGIKKLLDNALKEINKLVPVYKIIRYYVFGFDELIKTTTMKIKRYVEANEIRILLSELATTIKNAAGKNIDKLKELMAK